MFDWQFALRLIPEKTGVYLFKNAWGRIIYVGKAKNLKKRVRSYFHTQGVHSKLWALSSRIAEIEHYVVSNEKESLILEEKLIKQYQPKYNVSYRDDKRSFFVHFNMDEDFPRFSLARIKMRNNGEYLGPFPHSGALKFVIRYLEKEYGIRSCRPLLPDKKTYQTCHDDIICRCSAPCIGKISQGKYRKKFGLALDCLKAKGAKKMINHLREEMLLASSNQDFEKAAKLKDTLNSLQKVSQKNRNFLSKDIFSEEERWKKISKEFSEFLNLDSSIQSIECFDVSHISDSYAVAGMVRFNFGKPEKKSFRSYRIKNFQKVDDYASLQQVVFRRYSKILEKNLPDIVLIDGGKGQVSAVNKVFKSLSLFIPLIGLAKKEEQVFRFGNSLPISMNTFPNAWKFLQRVRDEAHRKANSHHRALFQKRVRKSFLDACPKIGEKRKKLLLRKFQSVEKIQNASAEEIANLPSISFSLAEKILQFLKKGK